MLLRQTVAVLLGVFLVASAAQAASITYFLDQSNDGEGWIPDSVQDYVQITISDSTTVAGDIDVAVEVLSPLTGIADLNFGIQRFLFNSTGELDAADIVGAPASWSVDTDYDTGPPHLTGNGFGRFEIELGGSGSTRQDPTLSFSIRADGDSIADYADLATDSVQGPSFFAVHVVGFLDQDPEDPLDPIDIGNPGIGECYDTDGQGNYTAGCNILTSAWFGGTNTASTPEPASVVLLVLGLGLIARKSLR